MVFANHGTGILFRYFWNIHDYLFNGIFTIYIYEDEPDLRYTKPIYKNSLNLCLIHFNINKLSND